MQARPKLKKGLLAVGYPSHRDEAVLSAGGQRCESVLYDFSSDGGAVSDISFGRMLPADAVIIGIVLHEITNTTSGGSATLTIKAGSTSLSDAIAVAAVATGTTPLASSATAIPLAAESELKLTIAVAALTAGKIRIFVRYLVPNDL